MNEIKIFHLGLILKEMPITVVNCIREEINPLDVTMELYI
jgi:hypothetical protein